MLFSWFEHQKDPEMDPEVTPFWLSKRFQNASATPLRLCIDLRIQCCISHASGYTCRRSAQQKHPRHTHGWEEPDIVQLMQTGIIIIVSVVANRLNYKDMFVMVWRSKVAWRKIARSIGTQPATKSKYQSKDADTHMGILYVVLCIGYWAFGVESLFVSLFVIWLV